MTYRYFMKDEFQEFCQSDVMGIAKNSSKSYASYLGRLNDQFFKFKEFLYEGQCIFDMLPNIVAYDVNDNTDYASTIINLLYFLPYENTCGLSKKAFRDGRSALAVYLVFVTTDEYRNSTNACKPLTKGKINNIIKFLQAKAKNLVYDYPLLSSNFLARLRTQDRFPVNGVYYPVRSLSKIFKNDSIHDFAKLLREMVDHILVFTRSKKDKSLHVGFLKNVRKMVFLKNNVEVRFIKDSEEYLLLTECANYILNGKGEKYAEQKNNCLRGINIQHKPAINGELQNVGKYQGLSELKNIIDQLCAKLTIPSKSGKASTIAKVLKVNQISPTLKTALWNDILKLDGAITLSLMDDSENKILKDK